VAERLKARAWRAERVDPKSRHLVTLFSMDRTICRHFPSSMSHFAVINRQLIDTACVLEANCVTITMTIPRKSLT
jgi:hypothetical protein